MAGPGAQCVLQLAPNISCDAGMAAFAALTFAAFVLGLFAASWALAWADADGSHPLALYITWPYADARCSRRMWAAPHRFGQKLWFALLTSAWRYTDAASSAALALLVFVSLIALLALQLYVRPYQAAVDNRLQVACLLLLMYGYFVSVLPGSSVAVDASVTVLQCLLAGHAVARWWLRPTELRRSLTLDSASDGASGDRQPSNELAVPLMPLEDGADQSWR
jgi:hypothetical protein